MRHSFKLCCAFFLPLLMVAVSLALSDKTYAQKTNKKLFGKLRMRNAEIRINDSTYMTFSDHRNACKSNDLFFQLSHFQTPLNKPATMGRFSNKAKNDFIHGDVTYDYFYRSAIDTPFAGSNIQQHNARANVYLMFAKQFPVTLQVNSRQTNSYLFRNYTDLNVQFNNHSYNSAARDKLAKEIIQKIEDKANDSLLARAISEQQRLQESSRQWLEDSRQLQQLIESKNILSVVEEQLKDRLTNAGNSMKSVAVDSIKDKADISKAGSIMQSAYNLPTTLSIAKSNPMNSISKYIGDHEEIGKQVVIDSIIHKQESAVNFIKMYNKRTEQYNQLKGKTDSLVDAYKAGKQKTQDKIDEVKNTFATGTSGEIEKKVEEYQLDSSKTFKWYKRIRAIQQFSVGRSMVDYSELSAKNISITGVQAVYQRKGYIAFATGGVDYRYRDFIARDYAPIKQYLNLLRFGVGLPEMNNLIFTIYEGKKQANYFLSNNQPGTNKVFGITLQGKFKVDDNNYIIAEVAKSSYPQIANSNITADNKTFNFSNHSNEAYSVQLFSRVVPTDTRIYGQYKYLGRNFQSFSTYNINSDFTAWQARVDQYFYKKQLFVTAGLRTNDYSNPYGGTAFKSNTIFKSLQATLRLRKWPVLSVGYMPSSQITSVNNQVIENQFYTFTASGNYVCRMRNGWMNSGIIYTKFYNTVPDTAFVYYNARNWFIYHTITRNNLSFNSSVTLSYNNTYNLLTIDQGLSARLGKQVSAGCGLKWNRLNQKENHLGYYGNVQFKIVKLGEFNLSFDRGFIPGITEKLQKNDFGRVTYIKTF